MSEYKNEDESKAGKYFALTIAFSIVIYAVRKIVLMALATSPTGATEGNGWLTLYEVHNTGAAFNILNGQPQSLAFIAFVTLIAIILSIIMLSRKMSYSLVSALSLLSAGVFMNLLERLQYGYVIDYIHCDFIQNFPMFNTADIMIFFGAIGIVFGLMQRD